MKLGRPRGVTDDDADTEASRRAWPDGYRAALSISFDDARRSQIDLGVPVIDQLGVRATFFVLPSGVDRVRRGWQEAIAAGHEVGNHTARHPCSANFSWSRHHAIEDLDLDGIAAEIADGNAFIAETLGVEPQSFAYPCGHTFVGRGRETRSYVPLVAERFLAGRTFNDVSTNSPLHGDLAQIRARNSDGLTFEQLRPTLEATLDEGAWLVLGGHEVGHRGNHETTMPATLAGIVEWCRAHDVWIDTIGGVATRIRALRQAAPANRSA